MGATSPGVFPNIVRFGYVRTVIASESAADRLAAETTHATALEVELLAAGILGTPTFKTTTTARTPHGLDEIVTTYIWA